MDGQEYPLALRHELLEQMPSMRKAYPDYASYAGQTVQDMLTQQQRDEALVLEAAELASVVIWNNPPASQNPGTSFGAGGARIQRLPLRGQLSPVYGIWNGDISCDGSPELLTAGNLLEVKPVAGPYEGSRGAAMLQPGDSLATLIPPRSGFNVEGAARAIRSVRDANGNHLIIVARNNLKPKVFQVNCELQEDVKSL